MSIDTSSIDTSFIDSTGFNGRILYFNSVLQKGRMPFGSTDQVAVMKHLAFEHGKWFNEQNEPLLGQFLMNLDDDQKVNKDDATNKMIYGGIHTIMNSIVTNIAKTKPRLSGDLKEMGSAYNDTKINQLDEFDFAYELNINTLLNENARINELTSGTNNRIEVEVYFEGENPEMSTFDIVGYHNQELDKLLSLHGNRDDERYKSMLTKNGEMYELNTEAIAFALFDTLDSVVSNLDLPANLSHGGYYYPDYSGLRLNVPAYLMQFAFHGQGQLTPFLISVDLVPVLKLPSGFIYQTSDIVDEYLNRKALVLHMAGSHMRFCENVI